MLLFYCMDNLVEVIKNLSEHQKQYIIRRVAGLDTKATRELIGIAVGTYNTWFHNEAFAAVHRQLRELSSQHKLEAIQILRRDNQLEAVILEGKIITRMKEEIDSGEYAFVRTNLAREVYSKLIADLDKAPAGIQVLSWQQRVNQIFPGREQGGEIINGEFEEVTSIEAEHQASQLAQASEQAHNEGQEETPS
jgi:hypothetical protein